MTRLLVDRFQYDTATPLIVTAQVFDLTTLPGEAEGFDGTAGYTLEFRMTTINGGTVVVDDAAATQPAVGYLRYDFTAADVDTAGQFLGWFVVTRNSDDAVMFFPARGTPIEITIHAVHGGAP